MVSFVLQPLSLWLVSPSYLSRDPIIPTSTLKKNGSWAICLGPDYLIFCAVSCTRLETIVVSFKVLALIWRPSASYLNLIPVFLAGTGMAGLFTTHFIALSAPSRGGHARTTITAYYLA